MAFKFPAMGPTTKIVVGVLAASYVATIVFRYFPGLSPEAVAAQLPAKK